MTAHFVFLLAITVAPFTGAWIEIAPISLTAATMTVAPFTGAWIEMIEDVARDLGDSGRSLYGSVD